MARFREFDAGGRPPWMIIFTDMMTLLLTFFIILVSMSVIDERSRVRAVESVRRVFGLDERRFNYDAPHDTEGLSSGALSTRPEDRRQEASQPVFADNQNITLRYTESSVVLEVSGDMLFEPGGAVIREAGRAALDRLVPLLLNMRYPAVIAGHAAPSHSEGAGTNLSAERLADGSWALSMDRGLAVYRHFIDRGVDKNLLLLESFGAHRPEYDNNSAEGRRKNRRVDVVLDKRNPGLAGLVRPGGAAGGAAGGNDYFFRDFRFDLELPPAANPVPEGGRR